ncbi:MAG: PBP1A family penicillin-binding protein [Gemmatimonadota bacterium]
MNERIERVFDRIGSGLTTGGRVVRKTWVWVPMVLLGSVGLGFGAGAWQNLCTDCPSIAQIRTWEPQQTSKVYSHDGRLLGELGIERRTPVSIHALPAHVPQAFVAIEDRRFYRHHGFDPWGITRAVVARVIPEPILRVITGQSLRQGGASTITQQLARNMFDAIGFEVRVERKLKELQVALELERAYSKDEILEAYMNEIYLGPGWYGIQTASRNYFGKNAVELNPAEGALLAAVANNAGYYSPFRYPDRSLDRRNRVLDRMALEGFLSEEEAQEWQTHSLPIARARESEGLAPYFVEWVRQILQDRFGSQLYSGGFQVYTSLDVDMQIAAEAAMERGFERIESRPGFSHPTYDEFVEAADGERLEDVETPYLQGVLIALDPESGGVRALVGGRDFTHSKFNRATQATRQPGSSFKTFVFASAFASGIPASHVLTDGPVVQMQVSGEEWAPENFSSEFEGPMTLREAYRRSINMIAIKLADEGEGGVGLETVAQTARRMGIRTPIPRVPSIAIGSPDVIPIQLAEAYASLATLGLRSQTSPILWVQNAEGEVIWEPEPDRTRVLDTQTARLTVTLMEDALNNGTGANVRNLAGLPREVPAGGKTGTTNNSTDVWFNGITPTLQATVWFGMDQPGQIYPGATGGGDASPVWGEFMREVYVGDLFGAGGTLGEGEEAVVAVASDEGDPTTGLPADPVLPIPDPWPFEDLITLEVDSETGLLASQWCPAERRYMEYYIPGTEPSEPCDDSSLRQGSTPRWPW